MRSSSYYLKNCLITLESIIVAAMNNGSFEWSRLFETHLKAILNCLLHPKRHFDYYVSYMLKVTKFYFFIVFHAHSTFNSYYRLSNGAVGSSMPNPESYCMILWTSISTGTIYIYIYIFHLYDVSQTLMLSKSFDKPLDKQQIQERMEEERDFQKKMKEVLWLGPSPLTSLVATQHPNEKSSDNIPPEFQAILDLVPADLPPRLLQHLEKNLFSYPLNSSIKKS
jgi:hypothetical protein